MIDFQHGAEYIVCMVCKGKGTKRKLIHPEHVWDNLTECPECKGKRVLLNDPCHCEHCQPTGKVGVANVFTEDLVEDLNAVGLAPIIIDENTDFNSPFMKNLAKKMKGEI